VLLYAGFSINYQYQHADGLNRAHPPRDWIAMFYAPALAQQQQQQQQQRHSKHDRHAKPATAGTASTNPATASSNSHSAATAVHEHEHSKQNRFAAAVTAAAMVANIEKPFEKPLDWRMVGWRLVPPANTGSVSAEPVMQQPGLYKAQYFLGSSSVAVETSNTFSVQCTRVRIGPVTTTSSATSGSLNLEAAIVPCAAQLAFAYSYSLRSAPHCARDWAGIVPLGEAVCARKCVVTAPLPAANSGTVLFYEGPTFPGAYAVHVFLAQHGDAPGGDSPPFLCRLFPSIETSSTHTTAAATVSTAAGVSRDRAVQPTATSIASSGVHSAAAVQLQQLIEQQQQQQLQQLRQLEQQQQQRRRCASFYVSTRWDMVLEREALRAAAQPALTQLFDDRRVTFRLIDLRTELPAQALSTAHGVSAALIAVAHCAPLLLCCLGELNDVELTAARSTDAAMLRAHPWVKDLLHPLRNSKATSSSSNSSSTSSSEVSVSDSRNPPARVSLTDVEVMFAHLLPALQRRVLHDSTPYSSSSSSSSSASADGGQCEAQQTLTLLGQFRAARAKCCEPIATAGSRGAAPDVGQPLTSVLQGETAAAAAAAAAVAGSSNNSSHSRAVNSSGTLFYTQHASKRSRVHPGMGGAANVTSSSTGSGTGGGGSTSIGGIALAIACMNDSKRHMVRLKHEVASADSSSSGSVSATSRGDVPVQLPPHYQTPDDLVAKVVADVTAYADRMYPVATLPTPREAAAMYSNELSEWLLCSQRYLPKLARTLYKAVSSDDAAAGLVNSAVAADVIASMQSPKHSAAASSRKAANAHSSIGTTSSGSKRKPNSSGKQRSDYSSRGATGNNNSFAEKLEYVAAAVTDEAAAAVTAATVTKTATAATNSITKGAATRSFNAVLADYINCTDASAQSLALAVVDHAGAGCTTALTAFMAWFCCANSDSTAQQVVVERTELGVTDAIQQYGRAPLARAVLWRQRWSAQELRYYRTSGGNSGNSSASGATKRASFVRTLLNRRTLVLYIDASDVTARWTAAALASHICAEVYDVFELPLPAAAVHDSSSSTCTVSAAASAAALLRGIELHHTDASTAAAAVGSGGEQHDTTNSTTRAQAAVTAAVVAQFAAMLQALIRADVGDLVLVIDGVDAITSTTARSDSISVQQSADSDSALCTAAQQQHSNSTCSSSAVLSFLPRLLPPCLRVVAAARAGGAAAAAIDKEPGTRWRVLRRKCHLSADDKLSVVNAVLLRRGKACCSDAVRSSLVLTERTANVQYLEQVRGISALCYMTTYIVAYAACLRRIV
jgi:hypothetical protein